MMVHDTNSTPPVLAGLRPIVVLGPTAGGKSELAVRLAEHYHGQVISADSMQVYRYMDVGTAKPSPQQQQRAVHHMVDVVEPTQRFTLSDWLAQAESIMAGLQAQGIRPIVVGGTNLYIKGLLEGLFEGPDHDPAVRKRLDGMTLTALRARLEEVDPPAAERLHRNDRRKMVRAIEVYEMTGHPISSRQTQWHPPGPGSSPGSFPKRRDTGGDSEETVSEPSGDHSEDAPSTGGNSGAGGYRHDPVLVGLEWPAEAINPRINLRVKAMFYPQKVEPELLAELNITRSLIEEVDDLESRELLGFQARQALGYKQVLDAKAGQMTMDEAYEKTKVLTRRFAKTQRTWLRRYSGVKWLEAPIQNAGQLTAAAIDFVNTCK